MTAIVESTATRAVTPTLTHPATSDDALVTGLLTSLFSGTTLLARPEETSPRAAYQDALYDRAVLVDLRPAPARRGDGELPTGIDVVIADGPDALRVVRRLAEERTVVLVSSDGVHAARIARLLRVSWVAAVEGGFSAWRRAGLPIYRHAV